MGDSVVAPCRGVLGFSPAMGLGPGGRQLPEMVALAPPQSLLADRSLLRVQRVSVPRSGSKAAIREADS